MCPVGLGHERLHIYSFRNNKGGEGGDRLGASAKSGGFSHEPALRCHPYSIWKGS